MKKAGMLVLILGNHLEKKYTQQKQSRKALRQSKKQVSQF